MNDKKQVKDLIEEIPNWEYTYIYEGSRACGKSYIQHLLNEKDKEIEILNNKIDKAIEYLKSDNYWVSQLEANDYLLDILKGSDNNE